MNKQVVAWVIGGALFAGIVGFWAWQLPASLKRAAAGQDEGLAKIVSVVGGTKASLSDDLAQTQTQLKNNLQKIGSAVSTAQAQAATIANLKNNIQATAAAAASVAPVTNVNASAVGLPAAPSKPLVKKKK